MDLKVMPLFFNTPRQKANAILDTIRDLIPEHAELTDEALLNTWEDFQDLQERAAGVDMLLELSENLRPVPIRFFLRLGDYGLPIILFGSEFHLAPRRLEAAGYWKSRASKVFLPLTRAELREQITLMAAKHRIEKTQALLIGSRFNSPYVVTSLPHFRVALRTLGIQLHSCEAAHFFKAYETAGEAQVSPLAEEWLQEAERVVEPEVEDVRKSARFYLAIKSILEETGAEAFALNCLPLVEELGGTPCMAVVRLNDEGIPAACEGDLTALMTMIFLERLASRPTFMGNIIYANPSEDIIEINHCVLPLRMRGYEGSKEPYVLRDYHGRGLGVTAAWDPEAGQDVTVARFDTSLRELVFIKGQLVGHGEDYCRSKLRVKVSGVREFIRQVRGNHHILVYGDHRERIRALCTEFGIVPVLVGTSAI